MMSSRFAQALQGRGPRLPRTVRQAFYACLLGGGLAAILYPQVGAGATSFNRPAKIAVINETPTRVTASAARAATHSPDELIVKFIPGSDPELSERSIERLLRLLDRVAERKRLERSARE